MLQREMAVLRPVREGGTGEPGRDEKRGESMGKIVHEVKESIFYFQPTDQSDPWLCLDIISSSSATHIIQVKSLSFLLWPTGT